MIGQDGKATIAAAIGTILFMELLIFGGWGIAVPIAVISYYILIFWQSKMLKIKQDIKNNILLIPIAMTALCFMFFDNALLKFFNILFLYGLIVLHTSQQFGINSYNPLSFRWFLEIIPVGLFMPIKNISKPINIINETIKARSKESNKIFLKIAIGLVIGFPIVFIATLLLMNTDAAFNGVIELISNKFNFDLTWILQRLICFVIIFFPLNGFFYTISNKRESVNEQKERSKNIKFDFIIVVTIASFLCVVYMIYCLSQLTYFISAFKGILPSDYTFAAYARKGFFECIPLGGINLILIIALTKASDIEENRKRSFITKGFIFYIITFTLFLVISAFSKMWLYISAYGITIMRVYVSWFLILGCIALILIGIKTYYNQFKLTKNLFIIFTVMFLGLNYANIDYRIGEYNVQLYETGKINTIGAFNDLSISALEPMLRMSSMDKNSNAKINKYKNRLYEERTWQEWNYADYKGRKILENLVAK